MKNSKLCGRRKIIASLSIIFTILSINQLFAQGTWLQQGNNVISGSFLGTKNLQPLLLKTNNLQRMIIKSDGWFGFGVSDPLSPFHIDGEVRLNNLMGEVDGLVMVDNKGVLKRISLTGNNHLVLLGDGTFSEYWDGDWKVEGDNMYSLINGSIAIGASTFNSDCKLEVTGNTKVNGIFYVGENIKINGLTNEINAVNGKLNFGTTNLFTEGIIQTDNLYSLNGTINFGNSNLTTTGNINANNITFNGTPTFDNLNVTNQLISNNVTSTNDLNLNAEGNINLNTIGNINVTEGKLGVGVPNPIEKLDVDGNCNIRGYLYVQDGVIIGQRMEGEIIEATERIETVELKAINIFLEDELKGLKIEATEYLRTSNINIDGLNSKITSTTGNINFDDENLNTTGSINASAINTETLNLTGNLGIGVAEPTERLDVDGNANIRGYLYVQDGVIIGQRMEGEIIEATERIETKEMLVSEELIGLKIEATEYLRTSNINIDGINSTISSSTGNINFDDENLNTTGDVNASTITASGIETDDLKISELAGDDTRMVVAGTDGKLSTQPILMNTDIDGNINLGSGGTTTIDGNITVNSINATDEDDPSVFKNLTVIKDLKVGDNSMFLSSNTDDGGITENSIYTDNGDLRIQSNGGTDNTILNDNGGNVGIGRTPDGYKLDVLGTGRFNGDVTIGSTSNLANLDIKGNVQISPDKHISLKDNYHGLGYFNSSFDAQTVNGPVLYGWDGGALGSRYGSSTSPTEIVALQWFKNGNVKIPNLGDGSTTRMVVAESDGKLSTKPLSINTADNGSVGIGTTAPLTIRAGADLFSGISPKLEILTGNSGTAYDELVTIRHNTVGDTPGQRKSLGLILKMSNENYVETYDYDESPKMGGMMLESSNAWSNFPSLFLLTNNKKQVELTSTGDFKVLNGKMAIGNPATIDAKLHVAGDVKIETIPDFTTTETPSMLVYGDDKIIRKQALPSFCDIITCDGNNINIGTDQQNMVSNHKIHGNLTVFGDLTTMIGSGVNDNYLYIDNLGNKGAGCCFALGSSKKWSILATGTGNSQGAGKLIFQNDDIDLITFDENGNVGIGCSNPSERLTVDGKIKVKTEVIIDDAGDWSDYVFDKDYKMLSIPELEKFIAKNKHLPNIPSAATVETEGLHIMDMNRRMMEKIEELTLYIIDLEKRLKSIENNNSK